MNTQQVLQILELEGISLASAKLAPAIAALLIKDPSLTDAQLVSTEDGTLKHYVRTKIGFFVDLFWSDVEPYVEQAITASIPQARSLVNASNPT